MILLGSTWRGIRAMRKDRPKGMWSVLWGRSCHYPGLPRFWIHLFTPKWHEGRGFYLSIGFYFVRIFRGY